MAITGGGSPAAWRGDELEDPGPGSSGCSSFGGSHGADSPANHSSGCDCCADGASDRSPPPPPGVTCERRQGQRRPGWCGGDRARACRHWVGVLMPPLSLAMASFMALGWLAPEAGFFAGALFPTALALLLFSGEASTGPGPRARIIRAFVVAAITMVSLLVPWVCHGGAAACDAAFKHQQAVLGVSQEMLDDQLQWRVLHIWLQALATFAVTLVTGVCLLLDHEPSDFTWKAVWSIGFMWLIQAAEAATNMHMWCDGKLGFSGSMYYMRGFCVGGYCCSVIIVFVLIWQRIAVFEDVLHLHVGSAIMTHTLRSIGALMLAAFLLLALFGWGPTYATCVMALVVVGVAAFSIAAALISALMCRPLRALWAEARIAKGVARRQTVWARNVLLGELIAIYVTLVSCSLHFLMLGLGEWIHAEVPEQVRHWRGWLAFATRACSIVDLFCNILGLSILSGLLQRRKAPGLAYFAEGISRRLDRKTSTFSMQSQTTTTWSRHSTSSSTRGAARSADEQQAWSAKVDELAHRGFRLESLLDFYMRDLLGLDGGTCCMPSFQPTLSTTRDVVREAIIPLSSNGEGSGGVALATTWNQGARVRAARMVTHAWSNIFTHLVAAIVADALGRHCYAEEADLLAEGKVEELKTRLLEAGMLQRVYWVCCFSVNQHASICGGYGPEPQEPGLRHEMWAESRLNTVTKERYPLCSCGEPKYFNSAPVHCELNKFDDMMALLSADTDFGHLVAMDRKFALLTRVWCLAEIAEANASQIPQAALFYDEGCVEAEYHKLKRLDIRECEATRQEDKDDILASIPDVDVFCESLQELIMGDGGLLGKFADREAKLRNAARFVRRTFSRLEF